MATARNSIATIPAAPDTELDGLYGAISSRSREGLEVTVRKLAAQNETHRAALELLVEETGEFKSDVVARQLGLIGNNDTVIELEAPDSIRTEIDNLTPSDGEQQ